MSGGLLGIGPDEDRVGDRDHLVDRQVGPLGVFADRLGTGCLVDADRADRSSVLLEDVAANPADVVGHLLVSDLAGALDSFLEARGKRGGETVLLHALEALQGERYVRLAERRPANEAFLYGWLANRIGTR